MTADIFGVNLSFVEKLWHRHVQLAKLPPKPHAGAQRPRLDATAQVQARGLVHDQPDATLEELGTLAVETTGIRRFAAGATSPLVSLPLHSRRAVRVDIALTSADGDCRCPVPPPRRGRAASTSAPSPTSTATEAAHNKKPCIPLHPLSGGRSAGFPAAPSARRPVPTVAEEQPACHHAHGPRRRAPAHDSACPLSVLPSKGAITWGTPAVEASPTPPPR
jgi:hypothetical protein